MCADECQKTSLPSGSSNLCSLSSQSPSSGRTASHSSHSTAAALTVASSSALSALTTAGPAPEYLFEYRTDATHVALASPLEMAAAMSKGEVCHATPAISLPSGSRTVMAAFSRLALAAEFRSLICASSASLLFSHAGSAARSKLTPIRPCAVSFCVPAVVRLPSLRAWEVDARVDAEVDAEDGGGGFSAASLASAAALSNSASML
mmetsp:Transcript_11960/g.27696  ORF Transcript_11960/g.27696 Transcript_11960/m.27696 type:complete len:206 (-) Transcript_11960:31-648(-)